MTQSKIINSVLISHRSFFATLQKGLPYPPIFLLSFSFSSSTFFFPFAAYGSSQAKLSQIGATAASHSRSHSRILAMSENYTRAHGNERSPTHWARPGIEPSSSQILVGFVSTAPQQKFLSFSYTGFLTFFFFFFFVSVNIPSFWSSCHGSVVNESD